MPTSIITTDDLREFKLELLDDIKELLNSQSGRITKRWLKSPEIKKTFGNLFRHFTEFKNQWHITLHQSWRCTLLRL